MATDEFSLIERYFNWQDQPRFPPLQAIAIGIGDDAAVLNIPSGKQLVVSTDTLISGVHFPEDTAPHAIGHKALAVNLSDLAAMGADPAWFTLALTLPDVNERWLEDFSQGLKSLANQHHVYLVGGDTTRGTLSITIQAMGWVDKHQAVTRSGARHQDRIYVSGHPGDAAAGLAVLQQRLYLNPHDASECVSRLEYPKPRHSVSRLMRRFSSTCIDVSDGLVADLSHILTASQVGAVLNPETLPFSSVLKKLRKHRALEYALTGGDDYELLFTIKARDEFRFLELVESRDLTVTCIGYIDKYRRGISFEPELDFKLPQGYRHF